MCHRTSSTWNTTLCCILLCITYPKMKRFRFAKPIFQTIIYVEAVCVTSLVGKGLILSSWLHVRGVSREGLHGVWVHRQSYNLWTSRTCLSLLNAFAKQHWQVQFAIIEICAQDNASQRSQVLSVFTATRRQLKCCFFWGGYITSPAPTTSTTTYQKPWWHALWVARTRGDLLLCSECTAHLHCTVIEKRRKVV